jgi:hypothetical protein
MQFTLLKVWLDWQIAMVYLKWTIGVFSISRLDFVVINQVIVIHYISWS